MLRERQLTFGLYGHFLNHRQAISPDGKWLVFDTRNEDSQIARTNAIEMVHFKSGEIARLYETAQQNVFGPGVGAASFHPYQPIVAFIHGLENCCKDKPNSATRRFGASCCRLVGTNRLPSSRPIGYRCLRTQWQFLSGHYRVCAQSALERHTSLGGDFQKTVWLTHLGR